jgi:pSer/pThr/pTyr-binding forkhead associated (FHA) protein
VLTVARRDRSKHASIVTVGRGEDCDVRVVHPLVSKRHAYFTQNDQGWHLADAESSNGTFVDGNRLEPHKLQPLHDSVVLRFGPEIKYRFFGPVAFFKYVSMRARMKA